MVESSGPVETHCLMFLYLNPIQRIRVVEWESNLRLQAAVLVVTLELFIIIIIINSTVSNYFCKYAIFPNLFLTCSELAL